MGQKIKVTIRKVRITHRNNSGGKRKVRRKKPK